MPEETEVEANKPFNFVEELSIFLKDAHRFDGYYLAEANMGTPKENIGSQVCDRVEYEQVVHSEVGANSAEKLLVPVKSKRSIDISAPPIIPHVDDELMPQELWEVAKADNPSEIPLITDLKCVEIGIGNSNTFSGGREVQNRDIYRVDLTRDKPVIYKRVPIPENELEKRDAMRDHVSDDEMETVSVLLDFVQPHPVWKYEEIDASELENIVEMIKNCRDY